MINMIFNFFEKVIQNDSANYMIYVITTSLFVLPLVISYLLLLLRKNFLKKIQGKKQLKYYLFQSFFIPIVLFQLMLCFYLAFKLIFRENALLQLQFFKNINKIIWIITLTILILRLIKNIGINYLGTKYLLSKTNLLTIQVSVKLINTIIIVSQFLIILYVSGVDIKSILIFTSAIFGVIITYVILNTTLRVIYHNLIKKVTFNGNYWLYIFSKSFYIPLHIFLIIEAFFAIYKLITIKFSPTLYIQTSIIKLHAISIVVIIAVTLIKFIQNFEQQLLLGRLTKIHPSLTTVQASGKLLRAGMFVIVIIISLPILGIPISGILAFSGASAVVVGIAVRPILANYFGGLLIYTERFFEVGDWIYSTEKDIEGTVEYIGWRSTRIRTFDKRPLYVPNSYFSEISVINASRMENRRIKENISIRYEDIEVVDQITIQIREMLKNHQEIDTTKTLLVHFLKFGEYSVIINIYTFTKTCNWEKYRDVQQDVYIKCVEIIKSCGGKVAIPQRQLHYNDSKISFESTKQQNK